VSTIWPVIRACAVGLVGGEPQVRGPGLLPGIGDDGSGRGEDPMDRRPRRRHGVVVLEVPAGGDAAGLASRRIDGSRGRRPLVRGRLGLQPEHATEQACGRAL
jgi:hypothetical protein